MTKKPRLTVTLEPRSYETLRQLAALTGESMSSTIAGFVDLAVPSLERVVVLLERAKAAPEEVRAGFAAALGRADRDVMESLLGAAKLADDTLADAVASTPAQ